MVLGQYLTVLGQYRAVWVETGYKATPVGPRCSIGSLHGDSGWYLEVVGQYRVVLVYQVIGRAESVWAALVGTGSI